MKNGFLKTVTYTINPNIKVKYYMALFQRLGSGFNSKINTSSKKPEMWYDDNLLSTEYTHTTHPVSLVLITILR